MSKIEGFNKYVFTESHAASFAIVVYASAWIKFHHPSIFSCALLNSQPMGFYSINQIITGTKKHGEKILPLCINNSLWDNTIEQNNKNNLAIRVGFRQIKVLQQSLVEKVI